MSICPRFCACASFPIGFEGDIWDLIVSIPDQCLSFYLKTASIFILKALDHPASNSEVGFGRGWS